MTSSKLKLQEGAYSEMDKGFKRVSFRGLDFTQLIWSSQAQQITKKHA